MACEMLHEVGASRGGRWKKVRGQVSTLFKLNQRYSTQKTSFSDTEHCADRCQGASQFLRVEFSNANAAWGHAAYNTLISRITPCRPGPLTRRGGIKWGGRSKIEMGLCHRSRHKTIDAQGIVRI